jgi:uroporphyrinogen-III decarboxylase
VTKLAEQGIDLVLHCDGNWDKNLEIMLDLPPKKCMIQFDGTTNIFRAKEILKGHSCIYGDVPAQLLATGNAGDVDQYCKKLIEIVGRDGGFCLGSGCELAPDAKPENAKAMFQSVRKYGYY